MRIWRQSVLFYIGGLGYCALELLWRGRTHASMFVLGGLCFLLLCTLSTAPRTASLPLPLLSLIGAALITLLEFGAGLVCNVALGLQVWDYSTMPCNLLGQICLPFSLLWIPVSTLGLLAGALLRRGLFGLPLPPLHLIPARLQRHRATDR